MTLLTAAIKSLYFHHFIVRFFAYRTTVQFVFQCQLVPQAQEECAVSPFPIATFFKMNSAAEVLDLSTDAVARKPVVSMR